MLAQQRVVGQEIERHAMTKRRIAKRNTFRHQHHAACGTRGTDHGITPGYHDRFRNTGNTFLRPENSAGPTAWKRRHTHIAVGVFRASMHRRNGMPHRARQSRTPEIAMGKYVFAWVLGVPAGLLALIYVLAHL